MADFRGCHGAWARGQVFLFVFVFLLASLQTDLYLTDYTMSNGNGFILNSKFILRP